jgi:hypothetical protein
MDDELRQLYEVLGIPQGASEAELRRAYRELVKKWHPDRFAQNPLLHKKAEEKLKQINQAYELLLQHGGASATEPAVAEEEAAWAAPTASAEPPPPAETSAQASPPAPVVPAAAAPRPAPPPPPPRATPPRPAPGASAPPRPPAAPRAPATEELTDLPRELQNRNRKGIVIAAVILLLLAVGGGSLFMRGASKEIALSVESNVPLEVSLKHAESPSADAQMLGQAPVRGFPGAHAGDTVVLQNPALGIYREEVLPQPEAGSKEVSLRPTFKTVSVSLRFIPEDISGLTIALGGTKIGEHPGAPFPLIEGRHRLEFRGDALSGKAFIDVDVRDGQAEGPLVDLRSFLRAPEPAATPPAPAPIARRPQAAMPRTSAPSESLAALPAPGEGAAAPGESEPTVGISELSLEEEGDPNLDSARVHQFIKGQVGYIRSCYERKLKEFPRLKGTMVVQFAITPGGRVREVAFQEDTLNNSEVAGCIRERMTTWRLPVRPKVKTAVAFPVHFEPVDMTVARP